MTRTGRAPFSPRPSTGPLPRRGCSFLGPSQVSSRLMDEKQIVEKCGWCGVRTALNHKASAKAAYSFDDESGWEEVQTWILYQCVSCNRPTLKELWEYPAVEEETLNTLLPAGTSDEASLPDPVANAWKAAQAVRHVEPNAFAVLVGRTLEVICREEGAKGRNLVESLRVLADSGRIPGPLGEMAQKLRQRFGILAHTQPPTRCAKQTCRSSRSSLTRSSNTCTEHRPRSPQLKLACKRAARRQSEASPAKSNRIVRRTRICTTGRRGAPSARRTAALAESVRDQGTNECRRWNSTQFGFSLRPRLVPRIASNVAIIDAGTGSVRDTRIRCCSSRPSQPRSKATSQDTHASRTFERSRFSVSVQSVS